MTLPVVNLPMQTLEKAYEPNIVLESYQEDKDYCSDIPWLTVINIIKPKCYYPPMLAIPHPYKENCWIPAKKNV
jgi:ribosomal protein S12 methylthiotransferase accessory factor YcaO